MSLVRVHSSVRSSSGCWPNAPRTALRSSLFSVPRQQPPANEKKTRQQLERERRTAEFVAENPGSFVVRATVAAFGSSGFVQGAGMFFFRPRVVHLVANPSGIRANITRITSWQV